MYATFLLLVYAFRYFDDEQQQPLTTYLVLSYKSVYGIIRAYFRTGQTLLPK